MHGIVTTVPGNCCWSISCCEERPIRAHQSVRSGDAQHKRGLPVRMRTCSSERARHARQSGSRMPHLNDTWRGPGVRFRSGLRARPPAHSHCYPGMYRTIAPVLPLRMGLNMGPGQYMETVTGPSDTWGVWGERPTAISASVVVCCAFLLIGDNFGVTPP
jgi:hypothetical protein